MNISRLALVAPLFLVPWPLLEISSKPAPDPTHEDVARQVFYAVLENCYEEGLSTEDVKIFLASDQGSGAPQHFVPGCPLCIPVQRALTVYEGRPMLPGTKEATDTFGTGLSASERESLRASDLETRLCVLHDFVERSMQRRITLRRLTPEERRVVQSRLDDMREKGVAILKGLVNGGFSGTMAGAKSCPSCDGGSGH